MKHSGSILLALIALAFLAGFGGWIFYAGGHIAGDWSGLNPIMLYVIGGLVVVGLLTGVLMWLAFYSSRKGYDEPYDVNRPRGGRR
jgi:cation transporter-like permease